MIYQIYKTLMTSHNFSQKIDYLYSKKIRRGFILRTMLLTNGGLYDSFYTPNLGNIINYATFGSYNLRHFKHLSYEAEILAPNEYLSKKTINSFPTILSEIQFDSKTQIILMPYETLNVNRNEKNKDMAQSKIIVNKKLEGKSKTAFEYSVLTSLLTGAFGQREFLTSLEQEFIDNFKKLSLDDQKLYYEDTRNAMSKSLG